MNLIDVWSSYSLFPAEFTIRVSATAYGFTCAVLYHSRFPALIQLNQQILAYGIKGYYYIWPNILSFAILDLLVAPYQDFIAWLVSAVSCGWRLLVEGCIDFVAAICLHISFRAFWAMIARSASVFRGCLLLSMS